jgi:hypothetical protein
MVKGKQLSHTGLKHVSFEIKAWVVDLQCPECYKPNFEQKQMIFKSQVVSPDMSADKLTTTYWSERSAYASETKWPLN